MSVRYRARKKCFLPFIVFSLIKTVAITSPNTDNLERCFRYHKLGKFRPIFRCIFRLYIIKYFIRPYYLSNTKVKIKQVINYSQFCLRLLVETAIFIDTTCCVLIEGNYLVTFIATDLIYGARIWLNAFPTINPALK